MAKTFLGGVALVAAGLALAWLPLSLIFLGATAMTVALFYETGDIENE